MIALNIENDPRVQLLASALDVQFTVAVGHLGLLRRLVIKFGADGNLGRYDCATIATCCGWKGNPERFIAAMIDAHESGGQGFLVRDRAGRLLASEGW